MREGEGKGRKGREWGRGKGQEDIGRENEKQKNNTQNNKIPIEYYYAQVPFSEHNMCYSLIKLLGYLPPVQLNV